MKILVTGADGFVGTNLCAQLRNIRDGKARNYGVAVEEVFECASGPAHDDRDAWCSDCGFVFNLAGTDLRSQLQEHGNKCPVMLASLPEAEEERWLRYGEDTGARVLVYRFPNVFGKWCDPGYKSAVAYYCNAVANDIHFTVGDPSVELELLYIDDLVDELIACLRGEEHRCDYDGMGVFPMEKGLYCYVPVTHRATIGEIVDLLHRFEEQRSTLVVPEIPAGSFAKKLYSTFLSYLPKSKVAFPLKSNVDARGSFTEILKTLGNGQFSVNVSNPGVTKGQHWHNTKWEFFIVVSGKALIQERRIGSDEIMEFEVSGSDIKAVHMLPGYTHNIINLSETEPLVTLMWANELFDPDRPDTYFEPV